MARAFRRRVDPELLRERVAAAQSAPAGPRAPGDPAPPPDQQQIEDWLGQLRVLTGVPFNYLVPDAAMLPPESIRFFQVDEGWVESLLDGASSLGFAARSQASAAAHTQSLGPCSGFLLRSAVVSGWPGMQVTAFADTAGKEPLDHLRIESLAPAVLLGLFKGVLQRLDLQEPSPGLHFGLDPASGGGWQKDLRYADGDADHPVGSFTQGTPAAVPMRAGNVVRVADLAAAMAPDVWTAGSPPAGSSFTAAEFGLEMIEGVQVVSFQLGAGDS